MVIHDVQCVKCGKIQIDVPLENANQMPFCSCEGPMEICWSTPRVGQLVAVHTKERSMVWRHPKTGKVAYPPTNNAPMPARYQNAGYERHELTSLKSVDKFCAEKGVTNEKANFNNGNGADN